MNRFVTGGLAAILASSMILGGASAAPARNDNKGVTAKDVHTDASGVSGWAVVDADGTLARKLNAKTVDASGGGQYTVHFNSNIRGCAYVGVVGLSGAAGLPDPGYVTVVGAAVDKKAVLVDTHDSAGDLSPLGFHLIVQC